MKTGYFRIIAAVIVTAAAGILLKLNNLDSWLIILGFRFHIGSVIPFLFIAGPSLLPFVKEEFVNPWFKRNYFFILMILLPLVLVMGGLYIVKMVELGDPEYFYEFGLSSVVDYPVYLVWNSIQLIMLYFFLSSAAKTIRPAFLTVFITVILLFGYEFIPAAKQPFPYIDAGIFIITSLIAALLISHYRNIYWFVVTIFSLLWSSVLLFGSSSKGIINILFASQYTFWEGLFEVNKSLSYYTIIIQVTIAFIICLSGLGLSRTKKHGTN